LKNMNTGLRVGFAYPSNNPTQHFFEVSTGIGGKLERAQQRVHKYLSWVEDGRATGGRGRGGSGQTIKDPTVFSNNI
jgi:hypothetical protein